MSGSNFLTTGAALTNNAVLNTKLQEARDRRNQDWTNLHESHKLSKFSKDLPKILDDAGHAEIYGVELVAGTPPPHSTLLILQKFLRANRDDLEGAKKQLKEVLRWRREFRPLEVRDEEFLKEKFGGLGYVVKVPGTLNAEDVVCFVKDGATPETAFGDYETFFRYRVALQELVLQQLNLGSEVQVIPDYDKGRDPYQAIYVHDYHSIDSMREIWSLSHKVKQEVRKYYPETISHEYIVNVPSLMQHTMGIKKALSSKSSERQSRTWVKDESELRRYLGTGVAKGYGGDGPELEEVGTTPRYV